MDTTKVPNARSLLQTMLKRGLLRTALVATLVLTFISIWSVVRLSKLHIEALIRANETALAQLISVGDYFQVKRQAASLMKGSTVSSIVIRESLHGEVIAAEGPRLSAYADRFYNGHFHVHVVRPLLTHRDNVVGEITVRYRVSWVLLLSAPVALLCVFTLLAIVLMRNLKKASDAVTEPIRQLAKDINVLESNKDLLTPTLSYQEVEKTRNAVTKLIHRVRTLQLQREHLARSEAKTKLALQVAHDIRSPISALSVAMTSVAMLPDEDRDLIVGAARRIQQISESLLENNPRAKSFPASNVAETIMQLLGEKTLEHDSTSFDLSIDNTNFHLFSALPAEELTRIVSNVINNGVEAIDHDQGRIKIDIIERDRLLSLAIVDNGKGMNEDTLNIVQTTGGTVGKTGGHGLGLVHAKDVLSSVGGSLQISSEPGTGTKVTLVLPSVEVPKWFATELPVSDRDVCVVDDDPSVIARWTRMLEGRPKSLTAFDSPKAFLDYWDKGGTSAHFILMDNRFGTSSLEGADLLSELGLCPQSVLVTGEASRSELQQKCLKHGLRMLPKVLMSKVRVA